MSKILNKFKKYWKYNISFIIFIIFYVALLIDLSKSDTFEFVRAVIQGLYFLGLVKFWADQQMYNEKAKNNKSEVSI